MGICKINYNQFSNALSEEEATGKTGLFKDPGTGGIRSISIITMCHMPKYFYILCRQGNRQKENPTYCIKQMTELGYTWVPLR